MQGTPGIDEDPRPQLLEPEVFAKPKPVELDPVVREQGLPEKEDHRFMDRWSLDRARDLGERVVRRLGLERLQEGTEEFGEWRALGHEVRRYQEGADDAVEIATADDRTAEQARRAEAREARAVVEEDVADGFEQKAKEAQEKRMELSAALRGSAADLVLWILAKLVLFAVDILVLHQALDLTTGSSFEHWATAGLIGAGVVVVGDVVGWALAAGTVRGRGTFRRPAEQVAIATALVVLLAVGFFVAMGTFRADSLVEQARLDEISISSPGFFTLAQILFFVGAAASCFSYIARSEGRELRGRHKRELEREAEYRTKASKLREAAEEAWAAMGEAPIRKKAAEARQAAREAAALAQAERDRQQAKYLTPLLDAEYLARRAEVESGLRFWTVGQEGQTAPREGLGLSRLAHPGLIVAALAAAVTFIATSSGVIAGTVGLSVLVAIYVGLLAAGKPDEGPAGGPVEEDSSQAFVADVRAEPLPMGSNRASEIEGMVPLSEADRNGDGSGPSSNGAGAEDEAPPDA